MWRIGFDRAVAAGSPPQWATSMATAYLTPYEKAIYDAVYTTVTECDKPQ